MSHFWQAVHIEEGYTLDDIKYTLEENGVSQYTRIGSIYFEVRPTATDSCPRATLFELCRTMCILSICTRIPQRDWDRQRHASLSEVLALCRDAK